jgi:adenylate kinase family enzyme
MKILLFGNSGSGKSTYAKQIAADAALTHLDLDSIVWEPNQIAVPRSTSEVHAALDAFIASQSSWVIEGCYGELVQRATSACTKLVFLNPGKSVCLDNNQRRPWEPHKYQSPEQQDTMLANLQTWVIGYYERDDEWSYAAHRRIFDAFAGSKVELRDPETYRSQPIAK